MSFITILMHLYSINIYDNGQKIASKKNLSRFGFFEKKTVGEFMDFFSSTLVKESTNELFSVDEKEYRIHVFKKKELAYAIITDKEYPDYCVKNIYVRVNKMNIETIFTEFLHGPSETDQLTHIQNELAETQKIMMSSIDDILTRGEKLDVLIQKSDELGVSAKLFYKKARKMNSCCVIS